MLIAVPVLFVENAKEMSGEDKEDVVIQVDNELSTAQRVSITFVAKLNGKHAYNTIILVVSETCFLVGSVDDLLSCLSNTRNRIGAEIHRALNRWQRSHIGGNCVVFRFRKLFLDQHESIKLIELIFSL